MLEHYSPDWAESFRRERALLLRALEPWLATDLEHVGSTAVPGMSAKPVIDMLAGVKDLHEARQAVVPLLELDYHYRAHRPEAHLFDKPHVGDWRGQTHHLHLTEPGSDLWRERLAFRDALREDPALVAEYADWKARYIVDRADGPYAESKRPFVLRVLATRGVSLKPDEQRLTAATDGTPSH